MRVVSICIVATVLAAAAVAYADAASPKKKQLQAGPPGKSYEAEAPGRRSGGSNSGSDYYENVLERVPFGSQRWWEVYGRQHGTPQG